jgi:hypothetical protein
MQTIPVAGRVALCAYGVSLSVYANDARLRDALRVRAVTLGWRHGRQSDVDLDYTVREAQTIDLSCNGETFYSTTDRDALVDAFENHAKIELALRAPHHLFVHAGVVGWRGGAIVVPGRSCTGKTALVEALVRAGAEYYSDEFAVLDESGCVHPYAIPLSVRGPQGRTATPVGAIGGCAGTGAIPVAHIVITEYHAGSRWQPRAVSAGKGLLALMDNTVAARERAPDRTMPILRRAVERARIVRSRRGDAAGVAQALLEDIA